MNLADLFYLLVKVAVAAGLVAGIVLGIRGVLQMLAESETVLAVFAVALVVGCVLGLVAEAAVLSGDLRIESPVPPGCYRVDVADRTTYVMSGKVLVPITTQHNTYFPIPCPE